MTSLGPQFSQPPLSGLESYHSPLKIVSPPTYQARHRAELRDLGVRVGYARPGPRHVQLPMLMTPDEIGRSQSEEFDTDVSSLRNHFNGGNWGNRGGWEDEPGTADLTHIDELKERMGERGYDERYPVEVSGYRSHPFGRSANLWNGNHRAVAAHELGLLTPVYHRDEGAERFWTKETERQQDEEREDYSSGRREPLTHSTVRGWT